MDRSLGSAACQAACLPLFHQRGIAMLGSDTGNDINPPLYTKVASPIHQVGIVAMGLWILDNANREDVAKECVRPNRWEFMVSIGRRCGYTTPPALRSIPSPYSDPTPFPVSPDCGRRAIGRHNRDTGRFQVIPSLRWVPPPI